MFPFAVCLVSLDHVKSVRIYRMVGNMSVDFWNDDVCCCQWLLWYVMVVMSWSFIADTEEAMVLRFCFFADTDVYGKEDNVYGEEGKSGFFEEAV